MFALDLKPIRPSLKKFEPFIDQCIYFALEGDVKIMILKDFKNGEERIVGSTSFRRCFYVQNH